MIIYQLNLNNITQVNRFKWWSINVYPVLNTNYISCHRERFFRIMFKNQKKTKTSHHVFAGAKVRG